MIINLKNDRIIFINKPTLVELCPVEKGKLEESEEEVFMFELFIDGKYYCPEYKREDEAKEIYQIIKEQLVKAYV